jgi:hypothetical protein
MYYITNYDAVITIIIITSYTDWAFWPIPIPRLVGQVPQSLQVGLSPYFLLGGKQTASEEFGQLAFLRCVRSNSDYILGMPTGRIPL